MTRSIPRWQSEVPLGLLLKGMWRAAFARTASGSAVDALERELERRLGASHAVAVSSARLALDETLNFIGLVPGDQILCTPLTIPQVIDVLVARGLSPVFVEMESGSFAPNLEDASAKLTPRTRAFLTTHLWGVPHAADEVARFASEHDVALIEDASQCFGGEIAGRAVGTFGLAGIFSMVVTKSVTAFRGGVLLTNDDDLADFVRQRIAGHAPMARRQIALWVAVEAVFYAVSRRGLFGLAIGRVLALLRGRGIRDFVGFRDRSRDETVPFPSQLKFAFTEPQAKAALQQLEDVEERDARRRSLARIFDDELRDVPHVGLPRPAEGGRATYLNYSVEVPDPAALKDALWRRYAIDTSLPTIDPCHELRYFEQFRASLPGATRIFEHSLFLPMFSALTDTEARRIGRAVRTLLGEASPEVP